MVLSPCYFLSLINNLQSTVPVFKSMRWDLNIQVRLCFYHLVFSSLGSLPAPFPSNALHSSRSKYPVDSNIFKGITLILFHTLLTGKYCIVIIFNSKCKIFTFYFIDTWQLPLTLWLRNISFILPWDDLSLGSLAVTGLSDKNLEGLQDCIVWLAFPYASWE